jgi:hypothetical protein
MVGQRNKRAVNLEKFKHLMLEIIGVDAWFIGDYDDYENDFKIKIVQSCLFFSTSHDFDLNSQLLSILIKFDRSWLRLILIKFDRSWPYAPALQENLRPAASVYRNLSPQLGNTVL